MAAMSFSRSIVLLLFGILTGLTTQAGPSVTLAWSASPVASVIGYRLYQGQASQNYNTVTDAGGMTNLTITGLVPGRTYYFSVTAYEADGIESAFSTEISYTVPLTVATLQMGITAGRRNNLRLTEPTVTATRNHRAAARSGNDRAADSAGLAKTPHAQEPARNHPNAQAGALPRRDIAVRTPSISLPAPRDRG